MELGVQSHYTQPSSRAKSRIFVSLTAAIPRFADVISFEAKFAEIFDSCRDGESSEREGKIRSLKGQGCGSVVSFLPTSLLSALFILSLEGLSSACGTRINVPIVRLRGSLLHSRKFRRGRFRSGVQFCLAQIASSFPFSFQTLFLPFQPRLRNATVSKL